MGQAKACFSPADGFYFGNNIRLCGAIGPSIRALRALHIGPLAPFTPAGGFFLVEQSSTDSKAVGQACGSLLASHC